VQCGHSYSSHKKLSKPSANPEDRESNDYFPEFCIIHRITSDRTSLHFNLEGVLELQTQTLQMEVAHILRVERIARLADIARGSPWVGRFQYKSQHAPSSILHKTQGSCISDWQLISAFVAASKLSGVSILKFAFRARFESYQQYLTNATATPTFRSSALSILLSGRVDLTPNSQDGSVNTSFNPMELGGGPPRQGHRTSNRPGSPMMRMSQRHDGNLINDSTRGEPDVS
jgi:hypothetical protein